MQLNTNYQLLGKVTIPSSVATTEVRLYAKIGTQNIASNYTPVTSKIAFYRGAGNYQASSWQTNLNGDVSGYNSGKANFDAGETTLLEKTQNIYHNQDGTKGINIGAYYNDTFQGKNKTIGNVYVTLPTIPRASKFGSIPNFTIDGNENVGVPFSVPVTKYYSGFRDVLEIYIGGALITTKDNYVSGNIVFSSSELTQIYANMPNNSIQFDFYLKTFNGNVQIGSTQNAKATGTLSENGLKPSYDIETVSYKDINEQIVNLTGDENKIVKNISTLQVSVPVTANGGKGSTISKYEVQTTTVNGVETQSNNGIDTLVAEFEKPTTNQFVVKIYDSRGNMSEYPITVDLIDYNPPRINTILLKRQDNVEAGIYLTLKGDYDIITFTSTSNNVTKFTYEYKVKGTDVWSNVSEVAISGTAGMFNVDNQYLLDLDVTKEYDFRIYVYDKIGNTKVETSVKSADSYGFIDRIHKILSIGEIPRPTYNMQDGSLNVAGGYYVNGIKLEQKQADWNQTNTSAIDYIKNKPSIPTKFRTVTNILDNGDFTATNETETYTLKANYGNYDELLIYIRTDWNNIQCIHVLKETNTVSFNINIVQQSGYAGRGYVKFLNNNQIQIKVTDGAGWGGAGIWRVYGINYK